MYFLRGDMQNSLSQTPLAHRGKMNAALSPNYIGSWSCCGASCLVARPARPVLNGSFKSTGCCRYDLKPTQQKGKKVPQERQAPTRVPLQFRVTAHFNNFPQSLALHMQPAHLGSYSEIGRRW